MKIGLDAMGGDFGPKVTLEGAIEAAELLPDDIIALYGQEDFIKEEEKELYKWKPWKKLPPNIEIRHCEQTVGPEEKPQAAFQGKQNSSMMMGLTDHKAGKIDGFVSAGNTGALMLGAAMILGRLEGISRPALAALIPAKNGLGKSLLIDAGANADTKPQNLLEFGIMGSLYMSIAASTRSIRSGLLSIGEERTKGNQLTVQSYELLEKYLEGFKGNIEGRDLIAGKVDVIITDGFTGNIALKLIESIATTIFGEFKSLVKKSIRTKIGTTFFHSEIKNIARNYDYAEYGGAPLLGLNGYVIKSHGVSTNVAIKNAVIFIKKLYENSLNETITAKLKLIGGQNV